MALVIDAMAVPDHQDLRRFMVHMKGFCDQMGEITVFDQVQEMRIKMAGKAAALQPTERQCAGGTTRAVLEDHLSPFFRVLHDSVQLSGLR
mgnify:CR=1 FL=1